MEGEDLPIGWKSTTYGDTMVEVEDRAGDRADLPVLSLTKAHGPILASERFSKVLHSRDLSRYRVARRGLIVADPMLLWDGAIGVQRAVDAGLVSPDYRVYEPREIVDPSFLARVVKSPTMLPYYQGGARGTNVRRNRIARSDFLRIPLALPPIGEQRKIAAISSAVDEAIETTQAVIDQLQVVKKAMMAELLTRGLPGRHTRFKQTEIGEVPDHWCVVPISEVVVQCDYGISSALTTDTSGVAVLRMSNMKDGRILLSDLKYAPSAALAEEDLLRQGDVLFNRTNSKDLVGKVGVFEGANQPVGFASYLLRLRVRKECALGTWLSAVMNTERNQARLRSLATPGVSQVNINRAKMLAMQVPRPPVEEQAAIVAAIERVTSRIQAENSSLDALSALKGALMSVLLTGELRVTPDEAAA